MWLAAGDGFEVGAGVGSHTVLPKVSKGYAIIFSMKECSKCGRQKEMVAFGKNSKNDDGLQSQCRECLKKYLVERGLRKPDGWTRKTADPKKYRQEWTSRNPGYMTKKTKQWYQKNKNRLLCRNQYRYALRVGKLVRQPCEVCGESQVEGHHVDYSKPLQVVWLCKPHHREIHKGENNG